MNTKPTILIIFGTSGDLVRRYIIPAIIELKKDKKLNNKFKVIGVTRKENFYINDLIENNQNLKNIEDFLILEYMDLSIKSNYQGLIERIKKIESDLKNNYQIIVYLSLPSQNSIQVAETLGELSFFQKKKIKLLLEKPFGKDLKSAKEQIKKLNKYYTENQIYRVDHYLFKKIIPKIINLKHKIKINNQEIDSININALESIDVSNRINFYDKVGALKDMIQSHLLEITAFLLNDKNRLKALIDLQNVKVENKFGQYDEYQNQVQNHKTQTETLASITLKSKNKKLNEIKIKLNTGKALSYKETSIIIELKNKKIISLKEEINKNNNSYKEVLMNAINGNKKMFIKKEEVIQTWKILSPILNDWQKNNKKIFLYPKGSSFKDLI